MGKQVLSTEKANEIRDSLLDVILKSDELLGNSREMSNEGKRTLINIREATEKCLCDLQGLPEENTDGWIKALENVSVEIGKTLFSACLRKLGDIEFSDIVEILKELKKLL